MIRNNERYLGSSKNSKSVYTKNKQVPIGQSNHTPNSYTQQNDSDNNARTLPPVITSPLYLQGYLRSKVGEFMRVNFLIGTGTFIDKEGVLEQVGVDHIVLKNVTSGDETVADLYSIKFVEIPE